VFSTQNPPLAPPDSDALAPLTPDASDSAGNGLPQNCSTLLKPPLTLEASAHVRRRFRGACVASWP